MKNLNMAKCIDRYNLIMCYCGYEHSTIGTEYSEGTEDWGLSEMVEEAEYLLSCYYEPGHCRCEDKREDRARWVSETGKLKRFINAYKPFCVA